MHHVPPSFEYYHTHKRKASGPRDPKKRIPGRTDRSPLRGSPEGETPLARGLGDVPPVTKMISEGGRVGPTKVYRRETSESPPSPTILSPKDQTSAARRPPPQANAAMPLPPPPIPSHPTIPYPTLMPTHTRPPALTPLALPLSLPPRSTAQCGRCSPTAAS